MCAIAGILSKNLSLDYREAKLQSMLAQVLRRGPDAESLWQKGDYSIGQRQLHIMQAPDTTTNVIQPFVLADNYVLAWNGSIYNYIELRQELQNLGCRFSTDTDTEVLAQGLAKLGTSFLAKINGIFSISFWDIQKEELWLAVDRFGVKPLHYYSGENEFVFASESKQLIKAKPSAPNYNAIVDFLLFNAENNQEETFFKDVFSLRPGEFIRIKANDFKFEKYNWFSFDFATVQEEGSAADKLEVFHQLSKQAVQLQLRAAVGKGLGLSGGLDSVWLMTLLKEQNAPLNAFTVGSGDGSWNEIVAAQNAFNAVATDEDHFYPIGFKSDELINELNDLSYIQEEPFGDPSVYMQYRLMKTAAHNGIRVMLSGQGADELLLGYERYFLLEFFKLPLNKRLSLLVHLNTISHFTLKKYFIYLGLFSNADLRIKRILRIHEGMYTHWKSSSDKSIWNFEAKSYHDLSQLYSNEILKAHLPHLLRYEDRNAAAFGIEGRQPFLENNLSEFILKLPLEYKLNNGQSKFLLREALRQKGFNALADQKIKIGFAAPDSIWEAARPEMIDLIKKSKILNQLYKHLPAYKNNPRLLWKLQSVARWEKLYNF